MPMPRRCTRTTRDKLEDALLRVWDITNAPEIFEDRLNLGNLYLVCNSVRHSDVSVVSEVPLFITLARRRFSGFDSNEELVYKLAAGGITTRYKTLNSLYRYFQYYRTERLSKYVLPDYSFYVGSGAIIDDTLKPLLLYTLVFKSEGDVIKRVFISPSVYNEELYNSEGNGDNSEGRKKLLKYIKNKIVPRLSLQSDVEVCISNRINSFVVNRTLTSENLDGDVDLSINNFLYDNIESIIPVEDSQTNSDQDSNL